MEGNKGGDWKINDQVGYQGGLPEEVMFRWRYVGPAVVIQAETGGKNIPGRGDTMSKGHETWKREGLTERARSGQAPGKGLLYHVLLGVLSSLPRGRRGSPTRNARILTAGSQTMKRSGPEGLLETILQVETRPERGSNTLCLLLRNSLSLVPRCPGVC